MLFEIHLTCDECGVELVRLDHGFVCPEGHGKILPVGEAQDINERPIHAMGAGRVKQRSAKAAGDQIARALANLRRLEAENQQQLPEGR